MRRHGTTLIALLQRVSSAQIAVDEIEIGVIGRGLLVFIGIEAGDTEAQADRLIERLLGYRVFPDAAGKMNLSLLEVSGGLMLVPQVTLAADTDRGTRPSFSSAASPEIGRALFDHLANCAAARYSPVIRGRFGADMKVTLTNDGPVTFWLQVRHAGC
jgi:D-tyrosyl-tRNA(Tyr) deacylase